MIVALIIAPQSLSWQPVIDDLQGDFTARLNPPRVFSTLIYLGTGITRQLGVKGRAQGTSGSRICRSSRVRCREPESHGQGHSGDRYATVSIAEGISRDQSFESRGGVLPASYGRASAFTLFAGAGGGTARRG